MEEIYGMSWGPQQILSHITLKYGGFDVLHSGFPTHVINLSHNQLTHVTGISSYPKLLTELRLRFNSFDSKFPLSPPKSARWLAYWSWICPSPPYIVTSLPILIWSSTFDISAWIRLTPMVLSPPICTTCIISNTSPLNCCSLLYSIFLMQYNPAPPSSYIHDYYILFINKN